jgi:DHA3 family macrolide efflux protein-like MFS transporter
MKEHWKRDVALFIGSQSLSIFGSMLVQYAIVWYITMTAQSGAMLTISILCGILPTFFLSPFAGVWADRYNRKMLIILSDSIIALTTLVLALLFSAGYKSISLLFAASAIRAIGGGIQTPAVSALIPQMVPETELTRVNALSGSIQSAIMIISPMVSGTLMTFASIEAIFFIDVTTAALAVSILFFFLKVAPHAKALERKKMSYFHDLKEGFRYIAEHSYVKKFFLFCAFFFFFATPIAFLSPLQVTRSFGNDVWRLTAIEIAFSLGMTGGGILIGIWGGCKNRIYTMTLSSFLTGALTLSLGLIPIFWIYLIAMGIIGLAMPLFNTPATVLLQEKVEESFLGRVFGVMGMISSFMMPMGMLIFGPIADIIRIEWLLIGSGAMIFLLGFFLIGDKSLVEAGKMKIIPQKGA